MIGEPIEGEVNPEDPITQSLRGQWHKVLAFVMQKLGVDHVIVTADDLSAAMSRFPNGPAIVAHDKADGLHIRLVDMAQGQAMMHAHHDKEGPR